MAIRTLIAAAVIGISFAVEYVLMLAPVRSRPVYASYWATGMLPLPLGWSALPWLRAAFCNVFVSSARFAWVAPPAILAIVGMIVLLRRRTLTGQLLTFPVLAGLAAAIVRVYPYSGRLALYLVPLLCCQIAVAIAAIAKILPSLRWRWITGSLLFACVAAGPTWRAVNELRRPKTVEEIRPVLAYVQQHRQSGDGTYVYYGARSAYNYYAPRFGFPQVSIPADANPRDPALLYAELQSLRGRGRVWLIFSHVRTAKTTGDPTREDRILDTVGHWGRRLDETHADGAAAYLFDLSSRHAPRAVASRHAERACYDKGPALPSPGLSLRLKCGCAYPAFAG